MTRADRIRNDWSDAWTGRAEVPEASSDLPADVLDRFTLALLAQGALDALDLRRARWLASSGPERLVFLLLAARLRRGLTSSLVQPLRVDLERLASCESLETGDDPWRVALPGALRADLDALRSLLSEGLDRLDDAPSRLIRKVGSRAGEVVAFARYRTSEPELARRTALRISGSRDGDPVGAGILETVLAREPRLHAQQAAAVSKALEHRTLVVAGGPGTGKTTVVARILEALALSRPDWSRERVALCAPTGRAKARLQESIASQSADATSYDAWTLHALLGPRPDGTFRHDASNPLPFDVVVLDEASMVDQNLFAGLVASLHPATRWIVLGDPDQLPSVEAGGTFADLVSHLGTLDPASAPFVRLTHTWRNSGVLRELAEEVNAGSTSIATELASRPSAATDPLPPGDSVRLRWIDGPLEAVLDQWWNERLGKAVSELPLSARVRSSRILCATHGGGHGRERINALGDRWLRERELRPGSGCSRPLLLTRNLPASDLWNGDLGEEAEIDGRPVIRFPGLLRDRLFPLAGLEGVEPAWAITIHKSQGSEFDHVLLVLPEEDSPLLTRQILYTGLTRARRTLSIVGRKDLWEKAVDRRDDRSSPLFDLAAPA